MAPEYVGIVISPAPFMHFWPHHCYNKITARLPDIKRPKLPRTHPAHEIKSRRSQLCLREGLPLASVGEQTKTMDLAQNEAFRIRNFRATDWENFSCPTYYSLNPCSAGYKSSVTDAQGRGGDMTNVVTQKHTGYWKSDTVNQHNEQYPS
jgi:hypothetical protein